MVPHLRESFNRDFTDAKYRMLLRRIDAICGVHIEFRICETPVFLPHELVLSMERAGKEILDQLMSNPSYYSASEKAIPAKFRVPHETPHQLFVAVDFGITMDDTGTLVPKLIELQGFPTLFAFQPVQAQLYKEVYRLPHDLTPYMNGLDLEQYIALLRHAILADHDPENVILMELNPDSQKTRCDFILTERLCGIRTVNIRDVVV